MTNFITSFTKSIKHWYIPLLIGVVFIAFGFYVFTVPVETYLTLATIFSISFIVSGILEIVFSIENRKTLEGWGWYLTSGLLSLALGVYLIIHPQISMAILPFVVGITLMFRSFQSLGFSFDLKEKRILSWGNLAIASILGILLSFLLLINPFFTSLSLVSLTALSFIMVGISSIILAFQLKKLKDIPSKISEEAKSKIKSLQKEITDLYNQNIKNVSND